MADDDLIWLDELTPEQRDRLQLAAAYLWTFLEIPGVREEFLASSANFHRLLTHPERMTRRDHEILEITRQLIRVLLDETFP